MSVTFNFSSMNAGKTLLLLKAKYDYESVGMKVVCLVPAINNRDGIGKIKSRALNESIEARVIKKEDNIFDLINVSHYEKEIKLVLVDEVQFLTKEQVDQLCKISDNLGIHVMCYGLRTDSNGDLFEGSARLLAVADRLTEVKNTCHCGKKATMTLRLDKEGNVIKNGAQIQIGAEDSYISVCRKHWIEGKFK